MGGDVKWGGAFVVALVNIDARLDEGMPNLRKVVLGSNAEWCATIVHSRVNVCMRLDEGMPCLRVD